MRQFIRFCMVMTALKINSRLSIPENEIVISAIRAQGPGGQNVNKVASAVHLRFDIQASSLPDSVKKRLQASRDRRITREGIIVIKAQNHRSRDSNRTEALRRLAEFIRSACGRQKPRIRTVPTATARRQRLDDKIRRSRLKKLRSNAPLHE